MGWGAADALPCRLGGSLGPRHTPLHPMITPQQTPASITASITAATIDTTLAARQLQTLQHALAELHGAQQSAHHFSESARTHTELLAALPPRYADVLLGLLDRLESSALFTEESCSFSQKDLLANLQMWVDKAGSVLDASA